MIKDGVVFVVFLTAIGFLLIGMLIGGRLDTAQKYRQGQIDALTGKVKYELRVNSDSTMTWYKKGKND